MPISESIFCSRAVVYPWHCVWVIEVRNYFLTPLYFAEYGGYGGGGGGGGGYGAQSYSVPPPASGAPPAGGYTAPAAAYDQSQYAQWGQGVYLTLYLPFSSNQAILVFLI